MNACSLDFHGHGGIQSAYVLLEGNESRVLVWKNTEVTRRSNAKRIMRDSRGIDSKTDTGSLGSMRRKEPIIR